VSYIKIQAETTVTFQPLYEYTFYKVLNFTFSDGTPVKMKVKTLKFYSEKEHDEFIKNGATITFPKHL